MKDFLYRSLQIIIRFIIPLSLFILGFYLISTAEGGFSSLTQLFIAMACFVAGAFLIAPPIAKLISGPARHLYLPKGGSETVPMYAIADSLEKRGLFHQAIQEYTKISERHPDEVRPYVEMIRVSIDHLKDVELANSIYKRGITALKGKDGEKILSAMLPPKPSIKKEDHILEAFDAAVKKFEDKINVS